MLEKYKKQISFQQLQKEFLKNDDERIEYIKTELEKAYNEKNGDSVYILISAIYMFKLYSEKFVDILCKLTKEEWHGKHEDIVFYLQQLELPSTIDCIYELATSNFEKYRWDDNFALVRKCCFALGDINTPKAKEKLENSEVRCQWDPDRDIYGNPIGRRAIQLGIKGEMVKKYINDWIVNITDITDKVIEMRNSIQNGTFSEVMLPEEKKYII